MTTELRERLQTTLGDAYTLEREIGAGGMSRVFVAYEVALGRRVVVKVMPPDVAAAMSTERFRREIHVAARLRHPHIVPLLAAGDRGGLLYYTMPYVEGESLREHLARDGELPLDAAVRLLREVADALAYAHDQGVVHRDLKPANILLEHGHALVADFGVAKAFALAAEAEHDADDRTGALTSRGMAIGTPAYMAPEQAAADPQVDHRSDLYALGVLAYECLTGQPPFTGRSAQALLAAHVVEVPTPVATRRSAVPEELARLVARLLEKRPADRPQSAADVLNALDALSTTSATSLAASAGRPAAAPPQPDRARRPVWRRGLAAALAGGIALFVGALALVAYRRAATPEPSRVAVAPFENATGEVGLDAIGRVAADYIAQGIGQLAGVTVVEPGAGRAGTVLSGRYDRVGDSLLFKVQLLDALTGTRRVLTSVRASRADPLSALEPTRRRVMGGIALRADSAFYPWAMPAGDPPAYAAYEEFRTALTALWPDLIPRLRRAVALDSAYLQARLWLAVFLADPGGRSTPDAVAAAATLLGAVEAERDRLTPFEAALLAAGEAGVRGDNAAAAREWRRAADLGSSPLAELELAYVLGASGRPNEGLTRLARRGPVAGRDNSRTHWAAAGLLGHLAGRHREELTAARAARREAPERLGVVLAEITALAALDSVSGVNRLLRELTHLPAEPGEYTHGDVLLEAGLELRAHGHPDAAAPVIEQAVAWFRAHPAAAAAEVQMTAPLVVALVTAGRLDDARHEAEALARAHPDRLSYRAALACLAARRGERAGALRVSSELATTSLPHLRGANTLARAEIAASLGQRDDAVALLNDAFAQGLGIMERYWLHLDPWLESLRGYAPFEALIRPTG